MWADYGLLQFQGGRYQLLNPDDWQEVVDVWLADTEFAQLGKYYAVAKSGFGKLLVFHPDTGTGINIDPIQGIVCGEIADKNTERFRAIALGTTFSGIEATITMENTDFYIGESEEGIFIR